MQKHRILEGLHVLDFSRIVAGPCCTRILGDLGAQVTKVDAPPNLDSGPVRTGGGVTYNVGKRSIAIDLKNPEGLEVALRLASEADVLVENFRPGVMDNFGLGYEDLKPSNPGLIYASISGFGQTGASSSRRAYGAVAHSETGWLWVQQMAAGAGDPFAPGVTVADIATAMMTATGILAALYDRERLGVGQWIDMTLMECQMSMLGGVAEQALNGHSTQEWKPFRHPIHPARDGYMNINISGQRDWVRVARALGHEGEKMPDSIEEANERIAGWVAEQGIGDLSRCLDSVGAPFGVVQTLHEAVSQPYFEERGMIRRLPDPIEGEKTVIGSPFHFSEANSGPEGEAPLARGAYDRDPALLRRGDGRSVGLRRCRSAVSTVKTLQPTLRASRLQFSPIYGAHRG